MSGVRRVQVTPCTGSVLLEYDQNKLDSAALVECADMVLARYAMPALRARHASGKEETAEQPMTTARLAKRLAVNAGARCWAHALYRPLLGGALANFTSLEALASLGLSAPWQGARWKDSEGTCGQRRFPDRDLHRREPDAWHAAFRTDDFGVVGSGRADDFLHHRADAFFHQEDALRRRRRRVEGAGGWPRGAHPDCAAARGRHGSRTHGRKDRGGRRDCLRCGRDRPERDYRRVCAG